MKFKLDKKYFKITLYATGAVCFSILFYMFLKNIHNFTGFTAKIASLLVPFLYAFAFAYLLNPALKKGEASRIPVGTKKAASEIKTGIGYWNYLFISIAFDLYFYTDTSSPTSDQPAQPDYGDS